MEQQASATAELFSWVLFGSKVFGGLLMVTTAVLYAYQDNLLYFPAPPGFPKNPEENPDGMKSPAEWTISGHLAVRRPAEQTIPFENHYLNAEDGARIHVWLLLQPNSQEVPTLIYFHGNAGNMGFRLKNAAEMYALSKVNVLMMDYRGYGFSEGTPTERGINLDADAVLKFAKSHERLQGSKIVCFGRSLGGAVSIALADRFPHLVDGLIVENTFLSISAMVDVLMPFLKHLKHIALRINWDSDVKIQNLKQPIMFIAGDRDELVPPAQMTELHKLASKSSYKDFYSVLGGSHNDTWDVAGKYYYKRMFHFLVKGRLTKGASDVNETVYGNQPVEVVAPAAFMESEVEVDDYLMVDSDDVAAIPTMNTNFKVQ